MADEYAVLHNCENPFKPQNFKGSFLFKSKRYDGNFELGRRGDLNSIGSSKDTPKSPKLTRSSLDKIGSQIHCNYCKSCSHTMINCPKLKREGVI